MSQTVSDFIIQRLHQWGVRHIFGYPGDGINGVFGAMNRAEGKIGFVQARHEEMAAFMASAYAKFSGELGVCIATSGPGASSRHGQGARQGTERRTVEVRPPGTSASPASPR